MRKINTIEKFENEKKSLNYHIESLKEKLRENPNDELALEQQKKVESYITALDKQIEILKKETES